MNFISEMHLDYFYACELIITTNSGKAGHTQRAITCPKISDGW